METQTKQLTPTQERLVAKLRARGMQMHTNPEVRQNPYSRVSVTLPPLLVDLYDWIVSPTRGDNIAAGVENRQTWDRARMLFLALDADAYYNLID